MGTRAQELAQHVGHFQALLGAGHLDPGVQLDRHVEREALHWSCRRRWLATLDLAARVEAGELSANAAAMWREAITPANHRPIGSNNNVITSVQGNSRAYTLDRLKRQAPELFDKVVAGELSANAAAMWRAAWTPAKHVHHGDSDIVTILDGDGRGNSRSYTLDARDRRPHGVEP